jgi:hypothetical protein
MCLSRDGPDPDELESTGSTDFLPACQRSEYRPEFEPGCSGYGAHDQLGLTILMEARGLRSSPTSHGGRSRAQVL